ncbi:hypothetical protein BBD46_18840 [Natrialba sp. SSL1]|nr:hypothetical protein BBD46_18840 [Natrialba sp. SSL1]
MEKFERGEDLFQDEEYLESERYFRDAEQGFDAAADTFSEVRSQIRELEEMNSAVGQSEELINEAWDTAISFSTYSEFHKEDSIEAQDDSGMGEVQFEATQQTMEDEDYSRSVPDNIELTSEFVE